MARGRRSGSPGGGLNRATIGGPGTRLSKGGNGRDMSLKTRFTHGPATMASAQSRPTATSETKKLLLLLRLGRHAVEPILHVLHLAAQIVDIIVCDRRRLPWLLVNAAAAR